MRPGRLGVVVVVLAPLLAGCLGAAPSDPAPAPAAASLDLSDMVTGCRDVGVMTLADAARVSARLPPGFRPASEWMPGVPVPPGRAAVVLTAVRCEHSEVEGGPFGYAELLVPVEVPDLAEAADTAGASHAYSPRWYHDAPRTRAALAGAGSEAVAARISSSGSSAPTEVTGRGRVGDEAGELHAFEVGGPVARENPGNRFVQWHLGDRGFVVQGIETSGNQARLAKLLSCTVRAGSPAHHLLGTTNCAEADAIGWVVDGIEARVRYRAAGGPVASAAGGTAAGRALHDGTIGEEERDVLAMLADKPGRGAGEARAVERDVLAQARGAP